MDLIKQIDGKDIEVSLFNYIISFILKENGIPAPNAYFADKVLMGNIYNSKFRSGHYITMSKRLKKCGYKNDYPGPGSYLRFSEFGILVSKNARKQKEQKEEIKGENKIAKTEFNETSGHNETTKNETKVLETE